MRSNNISMTFYLWVVRSGWQTVFCLSNKLRILQQISDPFISLEIWGCAPSECRHIFITGATSGTQGQSGAQLGLFLCSPSLLSSTVEWGYLRNSQTHILVLNDSSIQMTRYQILGKSSFNSIAKKLDQSPVGAFFGVRNEGKRGNFVLLKLPL